jgi:hypothetical protein
MPDVDVSNFNWSMWCMEDWSMCHMGIVPHVK